MFDNKTIDTFVLSMIDIASQVEHKFSYIYDDTNWSFGVNYVTASAGTLGMYIRVVYMFPTVICGKPSSTGMSYCVWYDANEYNLISNAGAFQKLVEHSVNDTMKRAEKEVKRCAKLRGEAA